MRFSEQNLTYIWKVGAQPGITSLRYIPAALEGDFVSIGWAKISSVKGKTVAEIASELHSVYGYSRESAEEGAECLFDFSHIPPGALVLLYSEYKAYFGKVAKTYYWVPEDAPMNRRVFSGENYAAHRLGIEWFNKDDPCSVDLSKAWIGVIHRIELEKVLDKIKDSKLKSQLRKERLLEEPPDHDKPPSKTKSEITRYIRDTDQSRRLKQEYSDKCQVCGTRLRKGDGESYSEVHHLVPLNKKGIDTRSNMLVLCPNDHARFDYRNMGVDLDCKIVVQWKDARLTRVGELRFIEDHRLNENYVKRHFGFLNDRHRR